MPLDPNTMNYMKIKRFPMVCAVIAAIFVAVSASCSGAGRAGSPAEAAASAEEPMATVAKMVPVVPLQTTLTWVVPDREPQPENLEKKGEPCMLPVAML